MEVALGDTERRAAEPHALPDDAAVVRRVLDGDIQAFAIVVRRYNQRLYRLARAIVADDQEALDVVQEAYVRAFTNLSVLKNPEGFATWLFVIVRNESFSTLRRRNREAPTEAEAMDRLIDDADRSGNESPDGALEARRLRRVLEQAIDRLPRDFRVVFVLRSIESMSVRETAETLDLNEKTVKTRHFRAKRLLKEHFRHQLAASGADVYEFAGARCDQLTAAVMGRLLEMHG